MERWTAEAIIGAVILGIILLIILRVAIKELIKNIKEIGAVRAVAKLCAGIGITSTVICVFVVISILIAGMPRPPQDAVYENGDGSSMVKHITIYPGESAGIMFYEGIALEGNWSSEGFILYLDGYYDSSGHPIQITVAEPHKKNWGDKIYTNLYDMLDPFTIGGSITLPDIEAEIPSSITGTIKGIITYPTVWKNDLFVEDSAEISVPVIIDLIPMDEEYLPIAERDENGNKAGIAFWTSCAFMIISLVISGKKKNSKKQNDAEKEKTLNPNYDKE